MWERKEPMRKYRILYGFTHEYEEYYDLVFRIEEENSNQLNIFFFHII